MFGTLLKKQFTEIFRTYFFDQKKNKARSAGQTAGMFVLFAFLILIVFVSVCLPMCISLCPALAGSGNTWLYFAIIGLISIVLGTFGSVFTTYSTLYLAKDNDLLLSMPIPVGYIMFSRLLSVYLIGLMYSAMPVICSVAVYFVYLTLTPGAAVTAASVIGGIMFLLIISFTVFILSCGLGYVVAKISLKLKNKSFLVVLISLAGIAIYYLLYFKALSAVEDLVENAAAYGSRIKDSAYILYMFGSIGMGETKSILIFAGAVTAVLVLVWFLISKSFIKIATSTASETKKHVKIKESRSRSVGAALLGKEFSKFVSSAVYMLNAGLGVLLLPAVGVFLLIKGPEINGMLAQLTGGNTGMLAVGVCALVSMMLSMTNPAVASVSLEGKNIWIPQSLPVKPIQAINAKLGLQLILSGVPAVFTLVCTVIVLGLDVLTAITFFTASLSSLLLCSVFYMFISLNFVNLTWTNEMIPIKQGAGVLIAMLATWGYAILMGVAYLPLSIFTAAWIYLAVLTAVEIGLSALLYGWLKTKGSYIFANL